MPTYSQEDTTKNRFQLVNDENRSQSVQSGDILLRDALIERMRSAGIKVNTNWEEGQRVLDAANGRASLQRVKDFVLNAFHQAALGNGAGKRIPIGKLTAEGKAFLEDVSGIKMKDDVDFVLNASDLRHIYNDHYGKNEKDKGNNVPLTDEDVRSLVDVVMQPDEVVYGVDKKSGNKIFFFFKKNLNGTYNIAEVYGGKRGNLTAKSYFNTKRTISQRVNDLKKSQTLTSVTEGASSSSGAKIPIFFETAIENDEKIRKQKVSPVFYSNAERAVEGVKQGKASGEQWLAMIQKNGGLKAGEDKWLGLSDWLNERKGKSVTKEEVLDYIRENQVQVEETDYSDEVDNSIDDEILSYWRGASGNGYDKAEQVNERLVKKYGEQFADAAEVWYDGSLRVNNQSLLTKLTKGENAELPINSTRLEYTTEGLENKREIALTVPTIEPWNTHDDIHFGDAGEGRAVAWVRFGETADAGGKRVLVIDEIQSKRHQEGREKGYRSSEENDWRTRYKEIEDEQASLFPDNCSSESERIMYLYSTGGESSYELEEERRALRSRYYELEEERRTLLKKIDKSTLSVPDAPFDKNWHELAMKRMLRYAAENGYDKVAWTTGEQQAARYNIGNAVDKVVSYDYPEVNDPDGRKSKKMEIRLKEGGTMTMRVGENGNVIEGRSDTQGKKLSEVVGKELAKKIMDGEGRDGSIFDGNKDLPAKIIEGDNLRIGGEGMKGFYNQILPRYMDKYGKKWGVQTGEVELPNVEPAGRRMWSVDVTPEMKASVMEGQPMFFRSGNQQVYGYVYNDEVYIDKNIATSETPLHEYTHLWAQVVRSQNPEEWKNIVRLMKDTPETWDFVRNRYPDLKTDDDIAEETLAWFSGRRGYERLKVHADKVGNRQDAHSILDNISAALDKFWHCVADFLHIHYTSKEQVADQVLKDHLNQVNPLDYKVENMEGFREQEEDTISFTLTDALNAQRKGNNQHFIKDRNELTDDEKEIQQKAWRAVFKSLSEVVPSSDPSRHTEVPGYTYSVPKPLSGANLGRIIGLESQIDLLLREINSKDFSKKDFVNRLAGSLGMVLSKDKASRYTGEPIMLGNGDCVTMRVSDHYANCLNFIIEHSNSQKNYGVVIRNEQGSRFFADRNVNYLEINYSRDSVDQASAPARREFYRDILKGIQFMLRNGSLEEMPFPDHLNASGKFRKPLEAFRKEHPEMLFHKESQVTSVPRRLSPSDREIGGAIADRLQDMGITVHIDLRENRRVLKDAQNDHSESGRVSFMRTSDGEQYGFTYRNDLYLDPRHFDGELGVHEYAHLWCRSFQQLNPQGWADLVATIRNEKDSWDYVRSLYPDIKNDSELTEEVIATYSGKKGNERLREELERMSSRDDNYKSRWNNIYSNISKTIQDFWKHVGNFFNIKYSSAEDVYDQVMKDFATKVNPILHVEKMMQEKDAAYMEAVRRGDTETAKSMVYDALREHIGNGIVPFTAVGGYRGTLQSLAHKVKTCDQEAINEAAELMAPLIPKDAVLIPSPSHNGMATDMLQLSAAISEKTGVEVADVLQGEARMRQYDAKRDMGKALTADEMGIRMTGKLPEGKLPVVIDNVVATGNTAEACVKAIGTGLVVSLAGAVSGYGHVASLKSAAPVAYDRKGEVVPLSRRFDYTGSTYLSAIRKDMGYHTESEDSQEPAKIHGLEAYSEQEIKKYVREHFETMLEGTGIEARIVDMKVIGSRVEGNHDDNSDLDVLLEFEGDVSEDSLFNILNDNEDQLYIEGIPVDINPITESKSGTIQEFLERNRDYQKENDKQKDDINIENKAMPKAEVNTEQKDLFQMAIGTSFDISSEYHVKLNELEDQRANELSIDSDSGMAREDIPAYGNLESAQMAIINVAEETDMAYSAIRLPEVVSLQDYDDGVDMRTVSLSYYTVSKSGITLYEHATDAYDNENGIPVSELPDQDARKVIDFAQEFFGKQDESFLRHIDTPNVPEYALPAILNGDSSGLYEEDEKNVQQFFDKYKANHSPQYVMRDETPGFSTHPAFGLASDCVHVDVFESTTLRQLKARKAVEDGIDGMNQEKNEYSKYVIPAGITVKDAKLTRIEPKDGEKIAAWTLSANINGTKSEAMMRSQDIKAFFAKDADGHRNKSVTLDMLVAKYFGKQFAESLTAASTQEAGPQEREQAAGRDGQQQGENAAGKYEKKPAEDIQASLIVSALTAAAFRQDGIWLNNAGKPAPSFANRPDMDISPFNQLQMGLHSDANHYDTTEYTTYINARSGGFHIKGGEKGLPYNWYDWNQFQNKYNINDIISRESYDALPPEEKDLYHQLRTKEARSIFNIAQTTMPYQQAAQFREKAEAAQEQSGQNTDIDVSDPQSIDVVETIKHMKSQNRDSIVLIKGTDQNYAAYDEDARTLSDLLDLPAEPSIGLGKEPTVQVQFPDTALDTYLPKLVKAGKRVAVCDDLSDFAHLRNSASADAIYTQLDKLCTTLSAQDNRVRISPTRTTGFDCAEGVLNINNSRQSSPGSSIATATQRLNDALRAAVAYTGCDDRLSRISNTSMTEKDARIYDRLVQELAAGVMMARHGLPAAISHANRPLLSYWMRELKEKPSLVNTIERDVNNAVKVLDQISNGRQVDYAAIRGTKSFEAVRPSAHSIINTLNTLPDKDERVAVVIKDEKRKTAAVILPEGASLEKNNEIPGMNKNRYVIALRKQGYEDVQFYNAGGTLGLKQTNDFFSGKSVATVRLKQYELTVLKEYNLQDEIERTQDPAIEKVAMTKDDNNRPLLYVKVEGEPYFTVHPAKADIDRYFAAVHTPDFHQVRRELGQKYHRFILHHPDLRSSAIMPKTDNIDMSRINAASITKDRYAAGKYLLFATIDGQKQKPQEITKEQWNRLWLVDKSEQQDYKKAIAGLIFKERLQIASGGSEQASQYSSPSSEADGEEIAEDRPHTSVLKLF